MTDTRKELSRKSSVHATRFLKLRLLLDGGWEQYLATAHSCQPDTSRAVYLTNRHSRSLTIYNALVRLGILPNQPNQQQQQQQQQDQNQSQAVGKLPPWSSSGDAAVQAMKIGKQAARDVVVASAAGTGEGGQCVRAWEPGEELRITIAGQAKQVHGCVLCAYVCVCVLISRNAG